MKKRASLVGAGISILFAGLSLGLPLGVAMAMTASESGSGTNSACQNSYPAPYKGGAGVAKSFQASDGSTITITKTGAVIKQSRCATAYREGWVNASDICGIQSAQDLSSHLSSGSSSPNDSDDFTGCQSKAKAAGTQATPVTIVNNNSQSQSQSTASDNDDGTHASASASSKSSNGTSSSQAQARVLGAQTAGGTKVRTLPDTGPGDVLGLGGLATAIGTVGHFLYARRRSARG